MYASHRERGPRPERTSGRFLDEFGASLPVDKRMWAEDITGSIAHARMLARQGVISESDANAIEMGLSEIYREIRDGRFAFELADEDIHMAIERTLTERIGPAGARLHTARSRNDQVALDTRMYVKRHAVLVADALLKLRETILKRAEEHSQVIMPGYTHLQRAQPVHLAHHLLAYTWMFTRDTARVMAAHDAADACPLGSAALAGTTFPIDRGFVARKLGFSGVVANSMDAVSDRDFLVDMVYACSMTMVHLSRICEELIIWSSEEFSFVRLDDQYTTGSSIMPQKRNPDFAELTRGKTGRVVGDLMALLVMLKGLPLAYNKDMQEDKGVAFDAIDTTLDCLAVVDGMLGTMRVNEERMLAAAHGGFMAATDLADLLAAQGVPFREAHKVIGALVMDLEREGRTLQSLTDLEFAAVHPALASVGGDTVDIERVVARRTSEGGTARSALELQMVGVRDALNRDRARITEAAGE